MSGAVTTFETGDLQWRVRGDLWERGDAFAAAGNRSLLLLALVMLLAFFSKEPDKYQPGQGECQKPNCFSDKGANTATGSVSAKTTGTDRPWARTCRARPTVGLNSLPLPDAYHQ